MLEKDDPIADDAPVTDDEAECPPVTRELVNAFIGTQMARDRITQVVTCRCIKGTPEHVIEEIVQRAHFAVAVASSLPRSVPRMGAWLSTVAHNAVPDYFREMAHHAKYQNREADVEQLPPDPASEGDETESPVDPTAPPRPVEVIDDNMLGSWMEKQKLTAADKAVLEMIRYEAKTKASHTDVATRFGLGMTAYDNRLKRFKAKWIPAWKKEKERRNRMAVMWRRARRAGAVAGVVALGVAAWLVWKWMRGDLGERAPEPMRPVQSASSEPVPPVPVEPPVFNQALPPADAGPLKPPLR